MKAVILVGGQGTRLRPLTYNLPKPMIPVVNRPFLEHVIDYLKLYGVSEVILSMGYQPSVIRDHFGDGLHHGVKLHYVVESHPLGTAGGVKNVEHLLDGTFIVLNGDVLTGVNLEEMVRVHKDGRAKVTIALTPVDDPTAYGLVETTDGGRVSAFVEKPSPDEITTNLINAGIYVVEREVLDLVPRDTYHMFERGVFPLLLKTGEPVLAFPSDSYWIDVGTPEKYMAVHRDVLHGIADCSFDSHRVADGIWIGEGTHIDPSAKLAPPVVIGKNVLIGKSASVVGPAVIGDGCKIGASSTVEDAIVWRGCDVAEHCVLRSCVVANDTIVESESVIAGGAVVADGCVIGAKNRLDKAVKVMPRRRIEAESITF